MLELDKAVMLKTVSVTCDLAMSLAVILDAQYYIIVSSKKTSSIAMLTKEPVYDLDEAIDLLERYKGYWI